MSRAMNVKLTLDEVTARCNSAGVGISAIEPLPSGDTHLVCMTSEGALEMRSILKKHIIEGRQKRYPFAVPPSRW